MQQTLFLLEQHATVVAGSDLAAALEPEAVSWADLRPLENPPVCRRASVVPKR
jgi:hypothetical protein